MGQLGYALTGGLQGYAQGRQARNEIDFRKQQQQQQMSEDQWRHGQADKEWAFKEGAQARADLAQVERYLDDPNANRKFTPAQLAGFEAKRKAIYARHPDLDPSQGHAPAGDLSSSGAPATAPTGGIGQSHGGMNRQNAPGDMQLQAPKPPPGQFDTDGLAPLNYDVGGTPENPWAGASPSTKAEVEYMGEDLHNAIVNPLGNPQPGITDGSITAPHGMITPGQVGSLMQETSPGFRMPQVSPAHSAAPSPPPSPATATAPVKPPAQGPRQPFNVNEGIESMLVDMRKELDDPALTPEQRDSLRGQYASALEAYRSGDAKSAQALLFRAQAAQVAPDSEAERGLREEQTRGAEAERTIFRPRELAIADDKNHIALLAQLLRQKQVGHLSEREAAELDLKLRHYNLDAKRLALEVDKAGVEREMKKLEAAGKVVDLRQAQFNYEKSKTDPTFMQKLTAETIAKHAYSPDPLSHNVYAGPTNQAWNQLSGGAAGTTAGQAVTGPAHNGTGTRTFNAKAFLAEKDGLTPTQKKIVIEARRKMGYAILR